MAYEFIVLSIHPPEDGEATYRLLTDNVPLDTSLLGSTFTVDVQVEA